jgi:ATP-dependent Clp protease ATP-binding subunit ClpA
LNQRLLGQREAIKEFATTIAVSLNGRAKENRTKGFVFMAGPTGTGKTEMINLTARFLYPDDASSRYHRFDMAEYMHADSVNRLLGCPGQPSLLGQAIDRLNEAAGPNGTAFLLFDEIEKAYKGLITVLLAFDAGRVTTNDGQTRDLSRLFVFVTSNVGAADAANMSNVPFAMIRDKVLMMAEKEFRKETVARFDAKIVMRLLTLDVQREITTRLLNHEVAAQQNHYLRPIRFDEGVVNFLIRKGFTPDMGARNLRATVERQVGVALLPWEGYCDDDSSGDRYSRALLLRENRAEQQLVAVKLADEERSQELLAILREEPVDSVLLISMHDESR